MKFLAFLIITTLLAISSCELRDKLPPVLINCPLLPVENYSQTIFFDMDVHAHPKLKTCILQNSLSEKSVLLLNVYGTDIDIRVNITRDFMKTSDNPNVIIMTKHLTPKMVDSPLWKFYITSKWSLLYIIITDDSKFNCRNGTMNTNDFLLLEDIMNTLWHRFQIMRVGVTFPFACEQKMVIYNGKRPSARILYDRSIKLINATNSEDLFVAVRKTGAKLADDYPMLGSIFYRYPTSIKDCEKLHYYVNFNLDLTLGYCGLDGMIMHDILTHLKFNLTVPEDANCNSYGYALPGNASGTLGCIIRHELDISFNSRFMTLYSDEHIYYLDYVSTDTLCALIKKPDVIPLWHGVFNLFSPPLWVLIIAVVVAIGAIMWVTAMINKTLIGLDTKTFWYYLYNSAMTTILGYSPMKSRTFLMIRMACLLGSIFFAATYQGHMSRVYTTVKHFQQIKTLEDLYSSGTTLYTSQTMKEFMRQLQNPEDKLQAEFFERAHLIPGERLGIILQYTGAAVVHRKSDAKLEIMQQYSDHRGFPLIDILDECFQTYYLSYIARSGFPFFEDIQIFTQRLNEAGLPTMYYKWTQQMLNIADYIPDNHSEPRSFKKIMLKDQRVPFMLLFIGTIASVIVFAVEMWKGRRHQFKLFKRRS